MEYILFIHNNTDAEIPAGDWESFFTSAIASGMFRGGSEIGKRVQLGTKPVADISQSVGGYMRFESESVEALMTLLQEHPVKVNGGTLELCETPKT